jgi:hypothetical protein
VNERVAELANLLAPDEALAVALVAFSAERKVGDKHD